MRAHKIHNLKFTSLSTHRRESLSNSRAHKFSRRAATNCVKNQEKLLRGADLEFEIRFEGASVWRVYIFRCKSSWGFPTKFSFYRQMDLQRSARIEQFPFIFQAVPNALVRWTFRGQPILNGSTMASNKIRISETLSHQPLREDIITMNSDLEVTWFKSASGKLLFIQDSFKTA